MKENTAPDKTTIGLDEFVETLEKFVEARGIKCHTTECAFSIFPFCGIKEVHIHGSKCPHFNLALTPKDVSPGYNVSEGV